MSLPARLLLALLALALLGAAVPNAASAVEPGVQAHLMWGNVDDAERDRQLDKLQQGGAKVVRVDVGWASLELDGPGRYSDYHVRRLDAVVDGAVARGIRPLLTLMESPCWASLAPESLKQGCAGQWWNRGVQKYGPKDPQAYARIAAWVADRYEGRLAGLEVWNEPNHPEFFLGDDRAARYAALTRATYPAVKAVAPQTKVIAGALSESDLAFQSALYDHGIAGHYDAFSIHPYSHDAAPGDERPGFESTASFARGVPSIRANQLAHGDRTPLWLTESGWTTSTVRGAPWVSGVDEAVQARYLEEQAQVMRGWDYVDVSIWFNLKDSGGSDQRSLVGNYGLLREDGSEKPAFAAFRRAAATLSGPAPAPVARPVAPPTSVVPRSGIVDQPLVVRVAHKTGRLVVSGTAPAGTTAVTVKLHRPAPAAAAQPGAARRLGTATKQRKGAKRRKAAKKRKAAYRVKIKPKGKRRAFRRKLPKRLARRSWKVVATARVARRVGTLRATATAAAVRRPVR